MSRRQFSRHPINELAHASHLVRVNISELYFCESLIEEILGITRRMNHVGALDFIPSSTAQCLTHRLHFVKGSRLLVFEFDSSVAKHLLTQRIEHLADVLSTLCKQTNILDLSASCRLLYRKCKGAVVTTCQCANQGVFQQRRYIGITSRQFFKCRLPAAVRTISRWIICG